MKKQVLFIQGGGEGAYEVDKELVNSLRHALGTGYDIRYPAMPEEESSGYDAWKVQISNNFAALNGRMILIAHSVGGSILLRYLSEERIEKPIAGIFLIAVPSWGPGGWPANEFAVDEHQASERLEGIPIFFYHSRDDDIVPFKHLSKHAENFPQATIREFDGRGHQFNNNLSEVAVDIKGLQN